jgi:septal ring factor EnvC (AmiA/AmiB activator)
MNGRSLTITALFFLLLVAPSVLSQSSKQKELEARRQELLEEIKQINQLLFKTKGERKSLLSEVQDIDQRIRATENLIRVTNQQANLLSREINDNQTQIETLRDELQFLKQEYAEMIRKSYRSKSQQSRVMFLLSSESFLQAYKRLQYLKRFARYRKEQGLAIQEKTIQLQELNKKLLEQKEQKNLLIAENKKSRDGLAKEKKEQEALIASLRKDENRFAGEIREKQRQRDELDRQIEAIIREAIAASNRAAGKTVRTGTVETFAMTAEAEALAASFATNKGKLPWPVERGVVVRRYGKMRHPQLPNVTTFSSGVEIATAKDQKARAIFEGEVFQIQQLKGANKAIYVRHGSYISIYNNLSDVLVKKGDKVTTKQPIGTVATNGLTGKTVLKFLIYQNSNRMNPADWLYRM